MEELKRIFAEQTGHKIPEMREALEGLMKDPGDIGCLTALHGFFHSVYGTGSSIGLDDFSGTARGLEDRLSALLEKKGKAAPRLLARLEDTLNAWENDLKDLDLPDPPPATAPGAPDPGLPESLPRELVIAGLGTAERQRLIEDLSDKNIHARGAANTAEASRLIRAHLPDLLLLDASLPEETVQDLIRELREDWRYRWIPVFLAEEQPTPGRPQEIARWGADDLLSGTLDATHLAALAEARISRMESLRALSLREPLTESFGQIYFSERLEEEVGRFSRVKRPFSLALCHFDFIGDAYLKLGRHTGDHILREFASFLRGRLRRTDIVCRYGERDFAVILSNTDGETALKVMDRHRDAWATTPLFDPAQNKEIKITFSGGVCEYENGGKTAGDMLDAAEDALVRARSSGGNRVLLSGINGQAAKRLPTKVLVVDDSQVIRDMLLQKLQKDYEVFLAENGEEALDKIPRLQPRLIIADLMMPGINGLEMIKKIRANPENKYIAIIALTGVRQKKTVFEAVESGADDYVVKPIIFRELESRIVRLLKRKG